ncbi:hypothetical protein HCN44_006701 [Aphidius gifuensis]|uniref:Phosphatidylcholine transfer protein n=1 Tax=Aphidius gifuensis TaxID=684658 RepID=A0A835CT30_APHGI|nr:stAR-related lipid transfer protein 7, mitochondrial-like [Aphidius gifuensis]KAF7995594.1 hypothetical protein HCN44_006701 [Aphidius gifuensis]
MYKFSLSRIILRKLNPKELNKSPNNIFVISNYRFYGKYNILSKKLGIWFSEQRLQVTKACIKQFQLITSQRVRRSFKLFNIYTKLRQEIGSKEFLKLWKKKLENNTKEFLFSSIAVTIFNWDHERITDNELYSYASEIEVIHMLRDSSVVCEKCHLRLVIDQKQNDVKYCTCHGSKTPFASVNDDCEWKPFIEREDMLIWRKEEPNSGGLYAYKVFGKFSDVSAEEFLQVQVDVDYRKEWDPTAKELSIIDTDPMSISAKDDRTDVVYWEMIWPRLFSNRDYVYQRRWVVDEEKGIVVIVSKVIDHPSVPKRPDTYRVQSYWSYMVIKPCTKFNEPGIEFGLTYFDDPGVNIPSAVTAWVAMSGLPDFLIRMRHAAKDYKNYIFKKNINSPIAEKEKEEQVITIDDKNINKNITEEFDTTQSSREQEILTIKNDKLIDVDKPSIKINSIIDEKINNNSDNDDNNDKEKDEYLDEQIEKENGYLRYFFLTRLFA